MLFLERWLESRTGHWVRTSGTGRNARTGVIQEVPLGDDPLVSLRNEPMKSMLTGLGHATNTGYQQKQSNIILVLLALH